MAEIERRFIVTKWDPSIIEGRTPRWIRQGYIPSTDPQMSLSVRIETRTDGRRGFFRPKIGKGMVRDDSGEGEIDLMTAQCLFDNACPDCLRKDRYRVPVEGTLNRRWEIDLFQDELTGLVVVECEFPSSADTQLVRPPWIHEWIEVTDFLTNQHFARMATELRAAASDRPIHEYVLDSVRDQPPLIAITGGPCSGKTSTILALQQQMPDIHFVPEVASILISQVRVRPTEESAGSGAFQRSVFSVQRALEDVSREHARRCGHRAVVVDRGTMDNAAYLPGGVSEFERIIRVRADAECQRYAMVVHLDPPPRDIYEEMFGNNPARSETYEEALSVNNRLLAAWRAHPFRAPVGPMPTLGEKASAVRTIIEAFLGRSA